MKTHLFWCFVTYVVRESKPWKGRKKDALDMGSIVGSVVECSPATRAAWVRFPDDAVICFELVCFYI